jgi:cytochrome c oxidase subunit 2
MNCVVERGDHVKKHLLATVLAAIILVLAACSGSENSEDNDQQAESTSENQESTNQLNIEATNFQFNKEQFVVKSGEEASINFKSTEGVHGLAIDDFDINISEEGEATFTPDKPGEYVIYCSIPCGTGHADMKSTLVVE